MDIPPPGRLERQISTGGWSEIYRAYKNMELENENVLTIFEPNETSDALIKASEAIAKASETIEEIPQSVCQSMSFIRAQSLGRSVKNEDIQFNLMLSSLKNCSRENTNGLCKRCSNSTCNECLPLNTCVLPVDKEYDIRYINLYGLDAYLIQVYGNRNKAHEFMLIDEIYVAQNRFIEKEFFDR